MTIWSLFHGTDPLFLNKQHDRSILIAAAHNEDRNLGAGSISAMNGLMYLLMGRK